MHAEIIFNGIKQQREIMFPSRAICLSKIQALVSEPPTEFLVQETPKIK